MAAQSFENHTKLVPAFHFVVLPIFAANLVFRVVRLVHGVTWETAFDLLLAVAFAFGALYGRLFALTVQDRVIRLEMKLRLERLLPADLRARVAEFSLGQLVSMRFAGDAELPELARKVLEDKIEDRKAIKRMVRDWQPDWLRA